MGSYGLSAGIVHINDQPVNDEPQGPFGGVKNSGYGRFGGGSGWWVTAGFVPSGAGARSVRSKG
jgi:acyl-CoA reductase-like NAD-dependent aldehyde dehydrogenase